jgi:hypothetical protein
MVCAPVLLLVASGVNYRAQASGPRPVRLHVDQNQVLLLSGVIDVRSAARDNLLGAQELSADRGYYLVHFKDRPDRDTASRFVQAVSQENILHYIPYSAYLCRLDGSRMEALQAIEEIDWIGPWEAEYKISATVYEATDGNAAQSDEFVVTLFAGEDASAYVAQIKALGGVVHSYTQDRLHVHIDAAKVPQIAALNGVYWIERRYPMTPANDNGTWIVQTNQSGNRKVFGNGITGSGQVIGIADTGVDADHLMFWDSAQGLPNHTYNAAQRKIVTYYNWYQDGTDGYYPGPADPKYDVYDWDINQGHGSHVAGTAAGEWVTGMVLPTWGILTTAGYDFYEGNAFGAKLVFQDLARTDSPNIYPPPDLNDPNPAGGTYPGSVGLFTQAMADGAYIHLDPWNSAGGFGDYTSYSQDVDEMMWANRNFLVIFPTGDDGPGTTTLTPPATAKNCLSVGAAETSGDGYCHDSENVASFSSWGPAGGWGRIKPDVCAPGQVISSTLNNDTTDGVSPNDGLVAMQGTSMAAATVAGASALVRQYYMTGFYTPVAASTGFQGVGAFTPSAAMMKATIINSAEPMKGSNTGGTIPGNGQGWGRVLLDNALYFAGETRSLLVDDNTTGLDGATIVRPFFKVYTVAVGPGQPLVVDVAYTDPPGTAGSAFQMVNYLYVEVDHPNGITYYLSGSDNFSNGQSVPNTAFIYPDTVQKVRINNPDPGLYIIYVVAFQTDQVTPGWNVQPYALAVSGNLVQSQGYVQFDQDYYTTAGPLNVTLTDADLAGNGTANVTLTSLATGDTETATLTEVGGASGIFRGTFPAAPGAANPGNGTLEVADPDTLTVTYNDASPAGVRQDTAGIPPPGTITIVKDAVPDDPQNFDFTGDLGNFSLDDDVDPCLPNSRDFVQLPGTYHITETVPAGWRLAVIGCVDPTGDTTTNLDAATAAIVLDSDEHVTCTFTNTIACPTITLLPATLPNGTVGKDYNQTLTASGGTAPYTFAVTAGTLPPGLTLEATGQLHGTPTAAGTFNFTVTAIDANGCTGSQAYALTIARPVGGYLVPMSRVELLAPWLGLAALLVVAVAVVVAIRRRAA